MVSYFQFVPKNRKESAFLLKREKREKMNGKRIKVALLQTDILFLFVFFIFLGYKEGSCVSFSDSCRIIDHVKVKEPEVILFYFRRPHYLCR